MKVSVIVPVYNVEDFLGECLDSVLAQSLKEIEVICVNDGATDGSRAILTEYTERDTRVQVIDRENGGLSAARNTGLSAASGTYVYYLDSDDRIVENALERCVAQMDRHELDMLFFGGSMFFESEEIRRKFPSYESYYDRKSDYAGLMSGIAYFMQNMQRKDFIAQVGMQIARRDFLAANNLRFHDGILHEDNPYTFLCMMHAKKVMYAPERYFNYRVRAGSITTAKKSLRHVTGYLSAMDDVAGYACGRELSAELSETIEGFLDELLYSAMEAWRQVPEEEKKSAFCEGANADTMTQLFLIKALYREEPSCGNSRGFVSRLLRRLFR